MTIAESELVLDPVDAGDYFMRLSLDNFPKHLLNMRNWEVWAQYIGVEEVTPFSFTLDDRWEDVTVYQVHGISFGNILHAHRLTDEMATGAGLRLPVEVYHRLMVPFGLVAE